MAPTGSGLRMELGRVVVQWIFVDDGDLVRVTLRVAEQVGMAVALLVVTDRKCGMPPWPFVGKRESPR